MTKSKILSTINWSSAYIGKSKMTAGNEYHIFIRRNGAYCDFEYHTNINDTLCLKDIMYCLILDSDCYEENNTEYDFMLAFEFKDMSEGKKVYRGCKSTYNKLRKLFTEAEINALRSEVADN